MATKRQKNQLEENFSIVIKRQAEIPTVPSARVRRRRAWMMAAVFAGLGALTGLALLALAKITQVESMPPNVRPAAAMLAPPSVTVVAPSTTQRPSKTARTLAASTSATVAPPGAHATRLRPGALPPRTVTPETLPILRATPRPKPATPKPATPAVPLGPAEF